MKTINEIKLIRKVAEIAEQWYPRFNADTYVKFKRDGLYYVVKNFDICCNIFNHAMKELHVDIRIFTDQIENGYSIQDFCNEVMKKFEKRKRINLLRPDLQENKCSYCETKIDQNQNICPDYQEELDSFYSKRYNVKEDKAKQRTEAITPDDVLNIVILLNTDNIEQFIKEC